MAGHTVLAPLATNTASCFIRSRHRTRDEFESSRTLIKRTAPNRHPRRRVSLSAAPRRYFQAHALANENLQSNNEKFVEELAILDPPAVPVPMSSSEAAAKLEEKQMQVAALQQELDALYAATFRDVAGETDDPAGAMDEATFRALGRDSPAKLKKMLEEVAADKAGWTKFQSDAQAVVLKRDRYKNEVLLLQKMLQEAKGREGGVARMATKEPVQEQEEAAEEAVRRVREGQSRGKIVLISGFESFNVKLYRKVARSLANRVPGLELYVFSDRDITTHKAQVERALDGADAFFGSLLFDFDQVEWLREKITNIPLRLVFESSLELMGMTQIGTFQMDPSGKSKGPPAPVKAVLSKFSGGKEEDKMVGYLSFLKIGPKLLKWLPGKKVRDLRNWLTIYSYWNEGGEKNVEQAFAYLCHQYIFETATKQESLVETPPTGVYHPNHKGYFADSGEYLKWHKKNCSVLADDAPVVALLLYRKHVITKQIYIDQLIGWFEDAGLRPIPIFINGVEAHTIVRDQLTTSHEQEQRLLGNVQVPSLRPGAVQVEAIVNTIGFPLVGGPAGTMEGGRQAEVAKAILSAKNVPYTVAAPLLIQDMAGWARDGIGGLQSVVLYSLPELDGAIDTVALGGLVGDDIFLAGERAQALTKRLWKWINLRRKERSERKIAILVYGFPPGVGATGTAALLNVPKSLEALLKGLKEQGYDVGPSIPDGETLISTLSQLDDERATNLGPKGLEAEFARVVANLQDKGQLGGVTCGAAGVAPKQLKEWLTFPESWGPTEWGPIPFLPDNTLLVDRMENQWGDVRSYRGIKSAADGQLVVPGLQVGNVWIGVQPLLGLEGDPMRLLFERDLTPHPQYAAFYKWLQNDMQADAVVHFGMHGTVEWLPGAPLGNTALSWSDTLLGALPNVYVYAANNPSESIVAKRRGYGTIVSHNVPPYGRAGLYKQLAALRELVNDYREAPEKSQSLRRPIFDTLLSSGLTEDCPFEEGNETLTEETVETIAQEDFDAYVLRVYEYLQLVETRLFSEGLHVLGQAPSPPQIIQYLNAYFGDNLPAAAIEAVAHTSDGVEAVRKHMGGKVKMPETQFHHLEEAVEIRDLLLQNTDELTAVLAALNGEFVLPAAGGDLLRDGPGVLPTGRNIHALDPYRMPSPAAFERGTRIANSIIASHREKNNGAYPETVAVSLWGLDAIKTKGESVGVLLALVGARPVKEGTGRIARFELVPLSELGRPRIDVLANMSGIFRDSFVNVVELLDDMFQKAGAAVDEPVDMNFVRKHALEMEDNGLENSTARLFSNPAGDYGSMVNERVGAGNWEEGAELGSTWAARNAFSYGRGGERGTARPEVLQSLLGTTQHVVQEIDSVEYGLTDIQEYYANTGALKNAAQSAQGGKKVACSIVETFGKDATPRDLEATLRLEYRSKLLNPKWAEAMSNQGSGGAYEISQRMTALVGWGATADFAENWVYEGSFETYVQDKEMREKLRKNNPQAFSNVVRRMLEAAGRGLWEADDKTLQELREVYAEMDDVLEGIKQK